MTWRLHYFGDPLFTRGCLTVPTPVALPCNRCREQIRKGDRGVVTQTVQVLARQLPQTLAGGEATIAVPADQGLLSVALHVECMHREVNGSVGHQLKACPCFGGRFDDPPGLTMREAAQAAFRLAAELAYSNGKLSDERASRLRAVYFGSPTANPN